MDAKTLKRCRLYIYECLCDGVEYCKIVFISKLEYYIDSRTYANTVGSSAFLFEFYN